MLTITERAASALESIVASADNAPPNAGLRISRSPTPGQAAFALQLVDEPDAGDQLIEEANVPVYLEREAAELLDDQVLDAQTESERTTFVLSSQQPPEE